MAVVDADAWRGEWTEVDEVSHWLGLPQAFHSSGLAFEFEFGEISAEGERGWVMNILPEAEDRQDALREELGAARWIAFQAELFRQGMILLAELGYSPGSGRMQA